MKLTGAVFFGLRKDKSLCYVSLYFSFKILGMEMLIILNVAFAKNDNIYMNCADTFLENSKA